MQLAVVSRLKHPHFLELMGHCVEANNRILVYEYASLGSLHDVMHGRPDYTTNYSLITCVKRKIVFD